MGRMRAGPVFRRRDPKFRKINAHPNNMLSRTHFLPEAQWPESGEVKGYCFFELVGRVKTPYLPASLRVPVWSSCAFSLLVDPSWDLER